MGLEELREGILEKARADARRLESEAKAEAELVLSDARGQVKQILEKARGEAGQMVEAERSEAVANAHLENKREMAKARDELLSKAVKDVWHDFVKRARHSDYDKLLHKLVREGVKEVGGDAVVITNKGDARLVEGFNFSKQHGEFEGGAIITSEDGRIRVDSTLEALFAQAEDDVRVELYHELFKKREERGVAEKKNPLCLFR